MTLEFKGRCIKMDKDDYKLFLKYNFSICNFHKGTLSYLIASTVLQSGETTQYSLRFHRLIMGLQKGDRRVIDHINHDTLDNRKKNLRICTSQQNTLNSRRLKVTTSAVKGVSLSNSSKKKWRARVTFQKKVFYLGNFKTKKEASFAYEKKSAELFGAFKNKNKNINKNI